MIRLADIKAGDTVVLSSNKSTAKRLVLDVDYQTGQLVLAGTSKRVSYKKVLALIEGRVPPFTD